MSRKYEAPAGFAGGYVDTNPVTSIATVALEKVNVGSFVELTDKGVKPLSGAGKISGLVAKTDATIGDTVEAGNNVTLVTRGSMYATATAPVVANAKVFVKNAGNDIGSVVADNTEAEEINATFSTTVTAGVVAVKINL